MTISYELAKQLKEAGWPQVPVAGLKGYFEGHPTGNNEFERYYFPTLSELIEACGKELHCLVHTTNGGMDSDKEFWSAGKDNKVLNWSNGHSPEEAVANLYLALHPKETVVQF